MEGEGMDFEKRYNDQQRYVRELEAKNKEQGEILNTLYKDPTYQPVRDFIKKFEDGEVESSDAWSGCDDCDSRPDPRGRPRGFFWVDSASM